MKAIITIISVIIALHAHAQFFRKQFDKADLQLQDDLTGVIITNNGSIYDEGYTNNFEKNATADLTDGAGALMKAYLNMYRATKDKFYLYKFIVQSKNVQDRRDDEVGVNADIDQVNGTVYSGKTITTFRPNKPTWSSVPTANIGAPWLQTIYNEGKITYPMADFIYLVKVEEPSLKMELLPTMPYTDGSNQLNLTDFEDYADWLYNRIKASIEYYDTASNIPNVAAVTPWVPNEGGYMIHNTTTTLHDWNQQGALAKTMVVLYEMIVQSGDFSQDATYYLDKVRIIAEPFKDELDVNVVNDHYAWDYRESVDYPEDISHASLEVEFAYLCHKFGVLDQSFNELFDALDIDRLIRSLTESAYQSPLNVNNAVDGSNKIYDDENAGPNEMLMEVGAWCFLSQTTTVHGGTDYIGTDIYNIAAEIYWDQYIKYWDIQSATSIGAVELLSLSYLTLYEQLFNPVAANRFPGVNSAWVGAAAGDFDDDGVEEMITVRNDDGRFQLLQYAEGLQRVDANDNNIYEHNMETVDDFLFSETIHNWVDVAAGDFNNDGVDEFVAVRQQDGDFFIHDYDGTNFNLLASTSNNNANLGWAGIAAGDFDPNSPGDEFAAIRNSDGRLYLYRFDGTNIQLVANTTISLSTLEWAGLTAGDFDGNGTVEMAAIRNSDGDLKIYEYNGTVIQQTLTNNTPSSSSVWTDITAGDFDADGLDEIIAYRKISDGSFFLYKWDNGAIVGKGSETFTGGQDIQALGAGALIPDSKLEQLFMLRNVDGDMLMYSLEGVCPGLNLCDDDLNLIADQHDYHVPNILQIGGQTKVEADWEVDFTAGNAILMKPGFEAEYQSTVLAQIDATGALACGADPIIKLLPFAPEKPQKAIVTNIIKVYPNPNNGQFTLNVTGAEAYVVEVYDVMGKQVWNEQVQGTQQTIDLTQQPNGIYLVKVVVGDEALVQRIVKQ